jgi:GNAT superfamily N-acetyltransferase
MEAYDVLYTIDSLHDERTAQQIVKFFLSSSSFDDMRHTPGEINHFRRHPIVSLTQDNYYYWYAINTRNEIIGVVSGFENEQRTGGYSLDYIAVHRDYRNQGLATALIMHMIDFVRSVQGRYMLTYTCDLPPYTTIQRLFERLSFTRIGYCPDYYYEGEGRITFLRKF